MNNIDYTKLGAIGAQAAHDEQAKIGRNIFHVCISDKSDAWTREESSRTAYAVAVVKAFLDQVGEGCPSVGDCLQSFPPSPTIGQGVEAIRSLMLASFAKKMEAVAKLLEKWEKPDRIGAYYVCAADLRNALALPAVEVEPAEKWAKEKAAFAQGRKIEFKIEAIMDWTPLTPKSKFQWKNYCEYRIAPDQPAQPGKLTDGDLGEIGAKAAFDNRSFPSSYLCIDRGNAQWIKERDGRNAFARAVREAVEKEQGEELAFARQKITELQQEIGRAKHTDDGYAAIADQRDNALQEIARLTEDCKGLSMALDDTRERLVKAEKTAESKHGCWMQELAKVTALEKQLSEALPWRESCEKWQAEREKVDAQLATVTAERDRLSWRPVSVKPTKEDADGEGFVIIYGPKGTQKIFWRAVGEGSETHWLPFCPPPAPTAEDAERERFEKAWREYCPTDRFTVDEKAAAWHMWQAARAVKEGE